MILYSDGIDRTKIVGLISLCMFSIFFHSLQYTNNYYKLLDIFSLFYKSQTECSKY